VIEMLFTRLRLGLPRYAQYTRANPRWALMFALGRLGLMRAIVRGKRSGKIIAAPPSQLSAPPLERVETDLDTSGYAFGLNLPPDAVARIRRLADVYRSGEAVEERIGANRSIIYLDEFLDLAKECPTVDELARDPLILTIARRYLNAEPVLIGTKMWWSLAKESALSERLKFAQELFHYDLHDFMSIQFSFYLTDVSEATGPHVYVPGSHKRKRLRDQLTLLIGRSDAYIREAYGADRQVEVVGGAGFGFAHDPYCYHKAKRPTGGDRLMLQFEYARRRYQGDPFATAVPLKM
jgi:hypothetical protein